MESVIRKGTKSRSLNELNNKEAAFLVASLTNLAKVIQFVHGPVNADGQTTLQPATRALVTASTEVLGSRSTPLAKTFTKKMAKDEVIRCSKFLVAQQLTYLEQVVGFVEYLEYLRKNHVGMDKDDLHSSLAVFNIHQAYADLLNAKQIDVNRASVAKLHAYLLQGLR